jgi:hypothetical protein
VQLAEPEEIIFIENYFPCIGSALNKLKAPLTRFRFNDRKRNRQVLQKDIFFEAAFVSSDFKNKVAKLNHHIH